MRASGESGNWNMWGHCERCDRWFRQPEDPRTAWACPVCGACPLHIENRGPVGAGSRRWTQRD